MQFPIFKQENFNQPLGSSEGYTIAKFGCALCSVTAICNWYGRNVSPDQLNIALVGIEGFQSNGTTNADGTVNKTLLVWGKVAQLYGEILLQHNIAYPSTPADMGMIDSYLAHNQPVIVGVSFLHNPKDTLPTHYVVIFAKNADGTYQAMDPWFGDEIVFDTRYAVNGMNVAQAILQAVAYAGPAPSQDQEVNSVAGAYYQIGQEIHVSAEVPTGGSPETIDPAYGKISPTAPAKVIGYEIANNISYYHIDQTYIGGGTGFAQVEAVDNVAVRPTSVQQQTTEQEAPVAAHVAVPVTPTDAANQQASSNYQLYLQQVDINKQQNDRIKELEEQLQEAKNASLKLVTEIGQTKQLNSTLAAHLATLEQTDSAAVEEGLKAQGQLKEQLEIVDNVSKQLKAKPTLRGILQGLDDLFSKVKWAQKVINPKPGASAAQEALNIEDSGKQVLKILGIK